VFHLLSWLMGTGRGDYFLSNTALLTDERCEILTKTPRRSQVV
jgi:Xaa-Pro dipeptidase